MCLRRLPLPASPSSSFAATVTSVVSSGIKRLYIGSPFSSRILLCLQRIHELSMHCFPTSLLILFHRERSCCWNHWKFLVWTLKRTLSRIGKWEDTIFFLLAALNIVKRNVLSSVPTVWGCLMADSVNGGCYWTVLTQIVRTRDDFHLDFFCQKSTLVAIWPCILANVYWNALIRTSFNHWSFHEDIHWFYSSLLLLPTL